MEKAATMPAAAAGKAEAKAVAKAPAKKKEHWLVEVVGGMTVAMTIVSGLSLFYLVLEYATSA